MFSKKTIVFLLFAAIFASGCSANNKTVKENNNTTEVVSQNTLTSDEEIEKKDTTSSTDELSNAVLENDTELVNEILNSNSIDINEKNSDGKYPIEMVLIMDNCEMAKTLLEAGADPYVLTSEGISVYDFVMNDDNESLKSIFSEHSNINKN